MKIYANTTYDDDIKRAAEAHLPAYDWRLYKALLWQESKLDPEAESSAGAKGLAQFMPNTWEEWAPVAGYEGIDRSNPEASIWTGAMYLEWLLGQWSWPRPEIDRVCLAMASYNAGIGNILKAQKKAGDPSQYPDIMLGLRQVTGNHSAETLDYVGKILAYYNTHVLQWSYE